jgi:hypothetical protein
MDNSLKELNEIKFNDKKKDKRSNNVYQSRSYASGQKNKRGGVRAEDRVFHHSRRNVIKSILKSDKVDDLIEKDICCNSKNQYRYYSTNFNKTENILRTNNKKLSNKRCFEYQTNNNTNKKFNKIDLFLHKFNLKSYSQLYTSMQPKYVENNNLLNTHLEYYIRGKAKNGEIPITKGDVINICNEQGYNVLDIKKNTKKIYSKFTLAHTAIVTIFPCKPTIKYYFNYGISFDKDKDKSTTITKNIYNNIKKYGYTEIYLCVSIEILGKSLYNNKIYSLCIDNEMKDYTYYFVGSEGGSLAYCKGYDINKVKGKEYFMEEDNEGVPKTQEHYKGKTIERGELDDNDDKTSYKMSKLIYENLVEEI